MSEPDPDTRARVVAAYDAFNRRDVDAALAAMTADVTWANGWEGGHVHGHNAVRDYWTRQWGQLDPRVTPRAMTVDDRGSVLVDVDQVGRDRDGNLLAHGTVIHTCTFRDGLVARFDIVEPTAGHGGG